MSSGLLSLFLALGAAAPAPAEPRLVCIDAGHGGAKPGALGPRRQREKDLALQIALRLKEELETSRLSRVLLTREGDADVDLHDRPQMANAVEADVFVSVHLNSVAQGAQTRAHGVETYFLSAEATGEQAARVAAQENAEAPRATTPQGDLAAILADLAQAEAHRDASALAYAVHEKLVHETGAADRGVHQAPFMVLIGAQMPAILVEVGYLSSPAESERLADKRYQAKVARGIAAGVRAFFGTIAAREVGRGGQPPGRGRGEGSSALTNRPRAR